MKILGTGLTGLVGSRIVELLKDKYEFENVSRSSGVDILDEQSLLDFFNSSDADCVIHLAAKADVDGCEKDKDEDLRILEFKNEEDQRSEFKNKKTAWAVNVVGVKNVVDSCEKTGKKLIYISTDFVFDGEKDYYTEDDKPDPINWYGKTKYEGEKIVSSSKIPWTILRISYPYRTNFTKKDFTRVLIDKLNNRERLRMITDQVITPTFVDDLAGVLDYFFQNSIEGVYHATGSDSLSPYDIAIKIAKTFNYDVNLIRKTTLEEFFRERARRPFHLALKNDKIRKLGIEMKTFEEGLVQIKKEII